MGSFWDSSTPATAVRSPDNTSISSTFDNRADDRGDTEMVLPLLLVYSFFLIFSIPSNVCCVFILKSSNGFSDIERILYQSLALMDIFICSTHVGLYTISHLMDDTSTLFKMVYGMANFSYCESLGILVNVGLHRYILITRPLHHHRYLTRKTTILFQICFGVTVFVVCLYVALTQTASVLYILVSLVPIGLIIHAVTTFKLLQLSLHQAQRVIDIQRIVLRDQALQQNHQDRQVLRKDTFKGVRTILVLTFSFWISTVPLLFLAMLVPVIQDKFPFEYDVFCGATNALSTCWGPVIYYLTNKTFREATNVFLQRLKCLKT